MTKEQMAREILDKLNEASRESKYGGYIGNEVAIDIVCKVMFNKSIHDGHTMYHRCKGSRHGFVYVEYDVTEEEHNKVSKTLHRMLDKGVISISKSKKMVKPTMTADEWFRKEI